MKSTTNVFLEGLRTDLHPLSTSQQVLTDALNATMITYNGNEMMLQNDMGNTLIQDSATGNIMGLNPGFIPVGMKEHGGIMYITSVNKDGYGEIGTIPSPIIRDIYKDQVSLSIGKNIPIDSGDPIQITNKLYPADKFIANLQMTIDETTLKGIPHQKDSELVGNNNDPCDIILERQIFNGFGPNNSIKTVSIYSPVISYSSDSKDKIKLTDLVNPVTTVRKKGIYNLNLYSFFEQGKSTAANLNLLSAQVYGANGDKTSLYWFLHTGSPISMFPKDLFNATLNNDLKQVPVSTKPGKLAVKLIPETIADFGMLPRAEEPYNTPITYKTSDGLYYTYFPGFYYTSDSGLYVEKLTARVIDESTNQPVKLEYPYGKEVLFSRYDLSKLEYLQSLDNNYNDPFLNGGLKLWDNSDDLGLPHSRTTSSNTQILSPIVGLHTSKSTNFKSSTQGKDESAHSGVFRAVLGENYNHWYRLEVDYEDQYGGNKGTFTTRFNPYLNDVFGTNLSIDKENIHNGERLVIGSDITIGGNDFTIQPDNAYIQAYYAHPGDKLWRYQRSIRQHGLKIQSGKGVWVTPDVKFDLQKLNWDGIPVSDGLPLYTAAYTVSNSPENIMPLQQSESRYFYHNIPVFSFFTASTDIKLQSAYICIGSSDGNQGFISRTVSDIKDLTLTMMPTDSSSPPSYSNVYSPSSALGTKLYMGDLVYRNQDLKQASPSGANIPWDLGLQLTGYTDVSLLVAKPIYADQDVVVSMASKTYDWRNTDESRLKITIPVDLSGPLTCSLGKPVDDSNNRYPFGDFEERRWGITSKNYSPNISSSVPYGFFFILELYELPPLTCTFETHVIRPSYSITPYFCIRGINDSGTTVYTQRFGKTNEVDMVYQHNFELDNDGKAKNFIPEVSSKNEPYKPTPCSYNENDNPFSCYLDDFSTSLQLEKSGIYVLNIQRCPGVGNWTATYTDPMVNLTITIGNKTYSYPKQDGTKLSENWSVAAVDTNNYGYKTSHGETSNMRIYVPIVLIVQEASKVSINISAKGGLTFNRQSIGLYKINNVTDGDITQDLLIDLEEKVYLYHDYMKIISEMAENYVDRVKQYNFIQKYGVFFKEAFVFVDGLYKDNNVNSITIGEKTYQPYPYIPFDSSILPVQLGADNNYYWNTYYMPEEVLNSDDCNFIFSNADGIAIIDDTFKSIKSGNLRQLIKQE